MADDSAGPTNVYRHDGAGRLVALTDGHGHTLRKRYDEWGNPVEIVERGGGVTRQEFDGGHLCGARRRPGRSRWPGTTPTGWSRSPPPAPGSTGRHPVLLRGRRAHPVGDRRPGGRGHPACTWPAAGAGRHRRRRCHGPPRLRRPPRRGRRRRRRWRGSSATPPGLERGHPGRAAHRAGPRRARAAGRAPRPGRRRGATSTAPRAGPRWSTRPGRARRPPTVRTARPPSSSTRSARSPPRATTCSATSPTAPRPTGRRGSGRSGTTRCRG